MSKHIVFYSLGTPPTNEHYFNATCRNLYGIEKSPSQVAAIFFLSKWAGVAVTSMWAKADAFTGILLLVMQGLVPLKIHSRQSHLIYIIPTII